jgi:hypothetical protein
MNRLAMLLLAAHLSMNASAAEQGGSSWANVEQLRLGQNIRVLCSGQRSWTGRLTRVSADAVVLDVSGVERMTVRSEVLRIQVRSRARSALIGLGIGAAGGLGVGYLAASRARLKTDEKTAATAFGAALCAAGGAGIGALVPSWKTVYSGSQSGSPPQSSVPRK